MVRLGLFLSSYAVLFAILALRFSEPALRITMVLLCALGVAAVIWILLEERAKGPGSYKITRAEDAGAEAAGYLGTYLLPFLTISEPGLTDLAAYALFLGVVFLIYVSSDMIRLNPLLYLFRRRVYRVQSARGFEGYLVAHSSNVRRDDLLATRFANDVLVEAMSPRAPSA